MIYGSNDMEHEAYSDKEWTALTPAVSGAATNIWSHIAESALLSKESYRFFRILGAENGNISEVEFYGTYHAEVGKIAEQIKELAVQEAAQSTLVYPAVPAGFTLSVASSSEVPEVPAEEIDVKNLAASMTASSGDWGGTMTADQCAQQLFDGDLNTYGDLASGNTYTIDFGEGKTIVPEKFEVYPRKGSGGKPITEHVERLNGVKFQGSNDGLTWVDITDELAGITKTEEAVKWYELVVIETVINGYRYIQITGGNGGNMAEVKMYGTVNLAESTTAAILPDKEDPSDEEGDSIAPGGSGMETPTIPDAGEEGEDTTKPGEEGTEPPTEPDSPTVPDAEEGEDTTKPGETDSEEALPVNKEDGIKKEDILPGLDGEEGTME